MATFGSSHAGATTECCSWHRRIDTVQNRFEVLNAFNDEVVLDHETGLVWERRPSTQFWAWPNARLTCAQKAVGGRGGWRLPAFDELATLIDPGVTAGPRLPPGHPFLDVQAGSYWTATVFSNEPGFAMAVDFNFIPGSDAPVEVDDVAINGAPKYAWAVRGGCPGPSSY
jgi:Protein of unknown function (DUF1566)